MASTRQTRPRSGCLVVSAVTIATLVGCGCWGYRAFVNGMDTDRRARIRATESVREKATTIKNRMTALLRSETEGLDDEHLLALLRANIETGPIRGTVFASSIQPTRRARFDVAFVAKAEAGGGLDMSDSTVRLCARFEGAPGRNAKVSMRDTPCGPGLPDTDSIDRTVKLSD